MIAVLRQHYGEADETIPTYSPTEIVQVINCANRVYQAFGSQECYPTHIDKIVALIINLNKGHYLSNGNKRVIFGVVILFLSIEKLLDKYKEVEDKLDVISMIIMEIASGEMTTEKAKNILINLFATTP